MKELDHEVDSNTKGCSLSSCFYSWQHLVMVGASMLNFTVTGTGSTSDVTLHYYQTVAVSSYGDQVHFD